jgi:hypothetical protein
MIIIIIITITIIGINPLTNQNSIQEEINSRLKSGDVCYQSVQNCLSSNLLSKNIQIKIYRTTILPVVLYGCEIVRSHWGRNVSWGCLRIRYWGGYLSPRGTRYEGVEKTTQWGVSWSVLLTEYHPGNQIKKNETGGPCCTYGGDKRCVQGFGGKTWGK